MKQRNYGVGSVDSGVLKINGAVRCLSANHGSTPSTSRLAGEPSNSSLRSIPLQKAILDDLSFDIQLENLAEKQEWFGLRRKLSEEENLKKLTQSCQNGQFNVLEVFPWRSKCWKQETFNCGNVFCPNRSRIQRNYGVESVAQGSRNRFVRDGCLNEFRVGWWHLKKFEDNVGWCPNVELSLR
ncbi:hypothetical protein QL285_039651 [Trifolium repens]|nr:hypothetical protein QL285_039651 [Trifolium repens]